jgi:ERCC4-related helicase
MKQADQLRSLENFKAGLFNTLVATSVAEEGLDIGEVDLIICFDAQNSGVRLVQRMGRTGRKRDGRVVMLVTEGREEQKHKDSSGKSKKMFKTLVNAAKRFTT